MRTRTTAAVLAILIGGGIAATFDIIYAFIMNGLEGRGPVRVLHSVASGWLGADAYVGGAAAAGLGLVSHYAILFVAAGVYLLASHFIPVMHRSAMLCGAAFGALVYLSMNFVVLPLSAVPFSLSYPPSRLLQGLISHAVLVGIPIGLAVKRLAYGDWNWGAGDELVSGQVRRGEKITP